MNDSTIQHNISLEHEYQVLLAELEATRETNRKLREQLKKTTRAAEHAERAAAEATRAHAKMVETLTETMRENNALVIDRDMWKSRAQRARYASETSQVIFDIQTLLGVDHLTEEEIGVIRKAVARLHHPDSGGNAERMKLWNAALDRLERRI